MAKWQPCEAAQCRVKQRGQLDIHSNHTTAAVWQRKAHHAGSTLANYGLTLPKSDRRGMFGPQPPRDT